MGGQVSSLEAAREDLAQHCAGKIQQGCWGLCASGHPCCLYPTQRAPRMLVALVQAFELRVEAPPAESSALPLVQLPHTTVAACAPSVDQLCAWMSGCVPLCPRHCNVLVAAWQRELKLRVSTFAANNISAAVAQVINAPAALLRPTECSLISGRNSELPELDNVLRKVPDSTVSMMAGVVANKTLRAKYRAHFQADRDVDLVTQSQCKTPGQSCSLPFLYDVQGVVTKLVLGPCCARLSTPLSVGDRIVAYKLLDKDPRPFRARFHKLEGLLQARSPTVTVLFVTKATNST